MLDRRRLLIILTMIFSAAVTPIAIRITQSEGVPSLVIVLIRLWLVSLALLPWIWLRYRRELLSLQKRQALLAGVSGFWLALNLLLLFVSLEYTSVLMTSLLRRTTPMWIILPEILIFGVVFSRRFWLSLVLTLVGVAMVGFGGLTAIEAGSDPLLGGALALIGSFCFGVYLLIGRKLNNDIPPPALQFPGILQRGAGDDRLRGRQRDAGDRLLGARLLVDGHCNDLGAGNGPSVHESGAAISYGDRYVDRPANRRCGQRRHRPVSLRRGSVAGANRWQFVSDLRRGCRHH